MSSGRKRRFLSEEMSFLGVARFDSAEDTQKTTKSSNRNTNTLSRSRVGCRETRTEGGADEAAFPTPFGGGRGGGDISAFGDKRTSGAFDIWSARASRAFFVARTRCLKSEYNLDDHLGMKERGVAGR